MRDAINGAKAGVTASIMRVGDNDYQLAISSSTTGENNKISSRSTMTTNWAIS